MISVTEARDLILSQVQTVGLEKVELLASLGRVLGEDIVATRNQPPWDNSAMDGYAVRAIDTAAASVAAPRVFTVIERLPAGYRAKNVVGPNQAIRIMTGAPIPVGADTVIRSEEVEELNGDRFRICKPVRPGTDLRRVGEDHALGENLLGRGLVIRPAEIGLLASNNRSMISVFRRPRVAILSSGDEIADIDEELGLGKIVDSNSYSLSAMTLEAGCDPVRLGISPDNRQDLEDKLHEGVSSDVILTSGGVSVGEFDFVKEALDALGAAMKFWKVSMTPGRPLAFGRIQNTLTFGLPGNPVAAMVTFELFVRPALLKMRGCNRLYRRTVRATLLEDVKKMVGRKQFFRMQVMDIKGTLFARRTGPQGSGILKSMSLADGLAVTHEAQEIIREGEEIEIILLGGAWECDQERSC